MSSTLILAGLKEEDILKYVDALARSRFAASKDTMGLLTMSDLVAMGVKEDHAKLIYAAVSARRCAKCGKVLVEGGGNADAPSATCVLIAEDAQR